MGLGLGLGLGLGSGLSATKPTYCLLLTRPLAKTRKGTGALRAKAAG